MEKTFFKKAKPIWINDINNTNVFAQFVTEVVDGEIIKIATSGFYQLFINSNFVSYGPARSGRGFFRVDEINIKKWMTEEKNEIVLIIRYYGVNTYCQLNQNPFVTCEITCNSKVQRATGYDDFEVGVLTNIERDTSRYSIQRGFVESYIYDGEDNFQKTEKIVLEPKNYIKRTVPYPENEIVEMDNFISLGDFHITNNDNYETLWWAKNAKTKEDIIYELKNINYDSCKEFSGKKVKLHSNQYAIAQCDAEKTGFISFDIEVLEDTLLYVTFDETLIDGYLNPFRLECCNVVKYNLKKGQYHLINFEPISLKYICFISTGRVSISGVKIIEHKHPKIEKQIDTNDDKIATIFNAAIETFRQNAVDIFMDCPSRERAGWLCDSYFTARAERFLTKDNKIEKSFLENFLMEDDFVNLPVGMFPMCFPAESRGTFIPNWAMWLVLELEECYNFTKEIELLNGFKIKLYKLVDYFVAFENKDGLLQNLRGWVFVDWSESNNNVQDVNFPSNMMYARMLECIGNMYSDSALIDKANRIRKQIIKLSYNGKFFCDNLIFRDGKLTKSEVTTESCQYYAFFTKTATKEDFPELWEILIKDFGPDRIKQGKYQEVGKSNAFVGNFIRLELLAQEEMWTQLENEIIDYFGYMAERTGTLWEKIDDSASMNHGFASQVAEWVSNIASV